MKRYLDAPLVVFVLLMVAAASITSHGTFVFYSYFLDGVLPYAATAVLTVGIPLLELAAVLDKEHRPRYIGGMVWLLVMEGVAQYFNGQAFFSDRVVAYFAGASGVDLVTLATQPIGRVLPIVYLATLSGVVVYFGYAASMRIRELRGAQGVAATITIDLVQPTTPQVAPQPIEQPPQLTDTHEVAPAPVVDMPRKQPTSKLAGVDVPRELRDRFGGNKQRMANHYGVSRQAIDNRMKGVTS